MPVDKVPQARRFGIISNSYKDKLEKEIREQQQQTDRSTSSHSNRPTKKYLILEVTEEFVRDYNRASYNERSKLNERIFRMLHRLKRKSSQCQVQGDRPIQLQIAWAELSLLSQCKSCYQEECLTTLYRALIYSPLNPIHIPTLFFLSETILYWLKNDAVLEPFLTSTELKLLKIGQLVFQLLYFHYLEGSTGPYEEFKIRLFTYLEGLDECESAYASYPNAVWCIRFIDSVGTILIASVETDLLGSRLDTRSISNLPAPEIPLEHFGEVDRSDISAAIQNISPILWHSVDVWLFVKKYSSNHLPDSLNQQFNQTILSLITCRQTLLNENWIDVVIAFQILADAAKNNVDLLETIRLFAQPESNAQLPPHKRVESHSEYTGWRSWPWQLVALLCECLTSIFISTDQSSIKRTVLFGDETSSENILGYVTNARLYKNEQHSSNASQLVREHQDNVCLLQMLFYRRIGQQSQTAESDKDDDGSWRVRYVALLSLSQIYQHLQSEPRHKTLNNLLWMCIHEYEKRQHDDRILEALKVGRYDDDFIQTLKADGQESQHGTIYTRIAQRLANGLLSNPVFPNMGSPKGRINKPKPGRNAPPPPHPSASSDPIPAAPTGSEEKRPLQIKKIIANNINDVFKRKDQVLQSIVLDRYRRELEEQKEETTDIVEQFDAMIERAMETTTLNENSASSVLTVSNKKFIQDPLQERRALVQSMGEKLIVEVDEH